MTSPRSVSRPSSPTGSARLKIARISPAVGDSSSAAAERFVAALVDIARTTREGVVVVVAHGGVTVDSLRALAGDASVNDAGSDLIDNGVPCGAITQLRVDGGVVSVDAYPSTGHLDETTQHRPV